MSANEIALVSAIGKLLQAEWPNAFSGAVPFGDDLAPLTPNGDGPLAWTTDAIMDGVDFDSREQSWRAIGQKALAVNLSDCAAMAARPVAALANLMIDRDVTSGNVFEIMRGAIEIAKECDCPIVGGDINSWAAPTAISMTVAAEAWPGCKLVRRDGMRPGDAVFVTGRLGGSILGRHMTFHPQIEIARRLVEAGLPTSMIDISDGLALDLSRVAFASGCGVLLDPALFDLAVHNDARTLAKTTGRSAIDHALGDGEDFELIVSIANSASTSLPRGCDALIRVGTAVIDDGIAWNSPDGRRIPIEPRGWEHRIG